ncbi:MAG: beta-propeller fold lactonase family protein [Janthinobacterium lividum]
MKWSWFGRASMALLSALAMGLSMTACGGSTIAYMWVIGQQYNQIVGFKVDHYTGNLTTIQNSPFSANGSAPVDILVRPGGRYVYVINQGSGTTSTANSNDSGIATFAVGGNGSLTFQQSYQTAGIKHLWAQFDGTGSYLYVLDQYSTSGDGNGAITSFSSDANTGRLILQTQSASTPSGGVAPTYLEVGQSPIMMASSSSCLYTVNSEDQTATPFAISSGQLTVPTTNRISLGTTSVTSINGNATYMVVTDKGVTSTSAGSPTPGSISVFTTSSGCSLTPLNGSPLANSTDTSDPIYSFISTSGKYLYVLNGSTTSTNVATPYSSITAYNLNVGTNAVPSQVVGSPFVTGATPVCMVEDPTGTFVYTSNQDGGTVTGLNYDDTRGELSQLQRGSTFTTPDNRVGCLALDPDVP